MSLIMEYKGVKKFISQGRKRPFLDGLLEVTLVLLMDMVDDMMTIVAMWLSTLEDVANTSFFFFFKYKLNDKDYEFKFF